MLGALRRRSAPVLGRSEVERSEAWKILTVSARAGVAAAGDGRTPGRAGLRVLENL